MKELLKNNQVKVIGEAIQSFTLSHETHGEKFYSSELLIQRKSGVYDLIPILVSEHLMDFSKEYRGSFFNITGQLRSHNQIIDGRTKVLTNVFVQEIDVLKELPRNDFVNNNSVELNGYLCKKPQYRETPFGRKITELLLAVDRPYGKSDYIPCICWGRTALFATKLTVGQRVQIEGRMQSRDYQKKISESETETKTTYEVSAQKILPGVSVGEES